MRPNMRHRGEAGVLARHANPCHPTSVRQGRAGESNTGSPVLAPTEQPPRKLSGTRTARLDDLERDAHCVHRRGHPRREARVKLSGTATDGDPLVGCGRSGPL